MPTPPLCGGRAHSPPTAHRPHTRRALAHCPHTRYALPGSPLFLGSSLAIVCASHYGPRHQSPKARILPASGPASVGWVLGSESLLGSHQSPNYTAPGGRVGCLQCIRRIQAWSVCQSYLCRTDLLFYFSPAGVRGAPFWRFRRFAHTGGTRRRGMSPTCDSDLGGRYGDNRQSLVIYCSM